MDVDERSIEIEVGKLAGLDLEARRLRWRNLFGRKAPEKLPKALLAKVIAYRRQAEVLGDLESKALQALRHLQNRPSNSPDRSSLPVPRRGPPPGTMLLREWNGQTHRVAAMQDGFAWNGTVYPSLSRIAREITGTSWNGFVFFGLKSKARSASKKGEGS
jgi:Protein of unknown function (DUF2924)